MAHPDRPARLDSREAAHAWLLLCQARGVTADSRRVREGDAFFAWPGHANDARRFVGDALAAGANACLVEADGLDAFAFDGADARIAGMHGLKAAAGDIAARFLGQPSTKLSVVAVTGTNGKTSTAWWIAQALGVRGRRCGVVGTLGIGEPPTAAAGASDASEEAELVSTGLTTPDALTLQKRVARLRRSALRGVRHRSLVDRPH